MSDTVNETQFSDLCRELNMDRDTEVRSISMFNEVLQRSSLEGNLLHWFCCALYAACRLSYTPTVGESNAVVQGNCISLNKLLRSCNMSISDFISKIKVWYEMANLPSHFRRQIEKLERTTGITFYLVCHFNEIFESLFVAPKLEKRNTKYSTVDKCSSSKLYDICWCLYLCVKNDNPNYNVDIVTSYHLLLCCFDFIYKNVLAENRVDLINPNFEGVPEKWGHADFDPADIANHCIIMPLCKLKDALLNDAKTMKDYCKNIIKKFFQTKTIFGDEETFLGILSNQNFERNVKSLNSTYEQYVLSVGEFDERIFLNASFRKPSKDGNEDSTAAHHQLQGIQPMHLNTPLTRKHSLPSETISDPVSSAINNVKIIQDIAKIKEPSKFIRQAGDDILKKINDKLTHMSNVFINSKEFAKDAEASNRFQMAQSLFFYLLDKILRDEIRTKPNLDLKVLLNAAPFITTLIACSVEIVLDAYRSQVKFPWILECFDIAAFHFYKIIEIVIRSHDGVLSRPLIKHLNSIEETCLDSLAWAKHSPLWKIIKFYSIPTWNEVDVNNKGHQLTPQLQSPINSAYDTFSTPVADTAVAERRPQAPQSVDGKRAASLPIFFRKFYKLAWVRLKELCRELQLDSETHLNTLWTLFEYSIMQTKLMEDRHLDQNIMCVIYIYIKLKMIDDQRFTDIMKFYRNQPQANSSIYRKVLIKSAEGRNGESIPQHRDIIYYYNNIYVQAMKHYACKFSENNSETQNNITLSPHPPEKQLYSQKLSQNLSLHVSRLVKGDSLHSPTNLTYEFSKSPAKELEKFNNIISSRCKQNLHFDNYDAVEAKRPRRDSSYIRKLQN